MLLGKGRSKHQCRQLLYCDKGLVLSSVRIVNGGANRILRIRPIPLWRGSSLENVFIACLSRFLFYFVLIKASLAEHQVECTQDVQSF
jgi:hypothetical protein